MPSPLFVEFLYLFFLLSSRTETLSPNYAPRTAPVVPPPRWGAGRRVLLSPEKPTAHDQPPPPPPLPLSLARASLASTPLLLSATRPVTSFSFYILLITLRRACVNRRINYKLYLPALLLSSTSRKKNKISHYNYNVDSRTRKTWEQFPLRNIIASCIFFFIFTWVSIYKRCFSQYRFRSSENGDTADSRRNDDVERFSSFPANSARSTAIEFFFVTIRVYLSGQTVYWIRVRTHTYHKCGLAVSRFIEQQLYRCFSIISI